MFCVESITNGLSPNISLISEEISTSYFGYQWLPKYEWIRSLFVTNIYNLLFCLNNIILSYFHTFCIQSYFLWNLIWDLYEFFNFPLTSKCCSSSYLIISFVVKYGLSYCLMKCISAHIILSSVLCHIFLFNHTLPVIPKITCEKTIEIFISITDCYFFST